MLHLTLDAPGVVSNNLDGTWFELFGLAALGKRHVLNTIRFDTRMIDDGSYVLDDPPELAAWDVEVPVGAQIFGATSGFPSTRTHQFWVGWLVGRQLHMQALKQEAPFATDLAEAEVPIFPAVMDKAGRAALYSWRPAAQGTELWQRTFTGEIKQAPTMQSHKVADVPGQPLASVAGVMEGKQHPTSHAMVGWVEDSREGAILGMVLIEADQVNVVRSHPVAAMSPLPRQRLGIWGVAWDCVELSAVVQTRAERPGYSVVRFSLGQNLPNSDGWWSSKSVGMTLADVSQQPLWQKRSLEVTKLNLTPGTLHASAIDHYMQRSEKLLHQVYLTRDGHLHRAYDVGGELQVVFRNIALDDPLAVLISPQNPFWGTRHPDGNFTMERF